MYVLVWNEQLKRMVEAVPVGTIVTDRHGCLVYANEAAEKITRLSQSEFIGRYYSTFLTNTLEGEPYPTEELPVVRVLETGEPVYGSELVAERPDGIKAVFSVNAAPFRDEKGDIVYVILFFEDITERKQLEKEHERLMEQLRQEREKVERQAVQARYTASELDKIINTLAEPVHIYGPDGIVQWANPASVRAHGFNPTGMKTSELARRIKMRRPDGREVTPSEIPSTRAFRGETTIAEPLIITVEGGKDIYGLASAAPLFSDGKIYGAVVVWHDATERKRAEETLAESYRLSDALNKINAAISSTLKFDEIMQRVVVDATKAIGAEASVVTMHEGNHWVLRYVYGLPEGIIGTTFTDQENRASVLAARDKKPVISEDAYNDERVNRTFMEKLSIRSFIVLPLMVMNDAVGVLIFSHHSAPVSFTDAQVDFASKIATAVSLALENARLYESQHRIADTLQSALLKIPGCIEGMEYGYLYRSATEAASVGGDFFDIFELEHDRVGIMVGDVSGKGLEAASLTSLVKNTVRAYSYEEESPAVIMAKTNNAVRKSTPASCFMTLFFGIVDMKSGAFSYCSAGHPPALLKRKKSSVVLLDVNSPVLGVFAGFSYENGSVTIEEGDILVLYSDGITEARCDGGFFGEERLVTFLKNLKPSSAKDTSQAIFDEVMRCTGGGLSDDVVLLSLALSGAGMGLQDLT